MHCYCQDASFLTITSEYSVTLLLLTSSISIPTKVTCENCGTQITKLNLARHKKSYSARTFYCTHCVNFFTESRAEKYSHIAKYVHGFYKWREHKRKEHGALRSSEGRNVDVAHVMGDVDVKSLKEEWETCKHVLVDGEMENGRHRVFKFAMDTLDLKNLFQKLYVVSESLKRTAEVNVAIGLVLKNVEDGSCRQFYAHEKNTLLGRYKLVGYYRRLDKSQEPTK